MRGTTQQQGKQVQSVLLTTYRENLKSLSQTREFNAAKHGTEWAVSALISLKQSESLPKKLSIACTDTVYFFQHSCANNVW